MTDHSLTLQSSFEDVDAIARLFEETVAFMDLVAGAIEEAAEARTVPGELPPLMPLLARSIRNFEERELEQLGMQIAKFNRAADAAGRPAPRRMPFTTRRADRAVA